MFQICFLAFSQTNGDRKWHNPIHFLNEKTLSISNDENYILNYIFKDMWKLQLCNITTDEWNEQQFFHTILRYFD